MFKERYDPEVIPRLPTSRDVKEILDKAGLKRCDCGTPIPDTETMCIRCKRLKGTKC